MKFTDFLANLWKPSSAKLSSVKFNIGPNATAEERLENAAALARMNPKGFRSPPSSRKNPRFHRQRPTTMLEKLAALATQEDRK